MTAVRERPQETVEPGGRSFGRIAALVLLVALCWATLFVATPAATGNPVLVSTSPGNGELVKNPDHVRLTFDRPVPAGLATVRVLDPGTGDQVVFERPVHPGGDENTISVPLPAERHEGTYAIAWTLPGSGLQPLSGAFTFDVFDTIQPDGVPDIETRHDTTVTVVHTAMRVLALGTMLLLVGAAFFVAAIGPAAARSRAVRRLVAWSWWGLVAATLGTFLSFGVYAAWAPLSGAFDPRLVSGAAESDVGQALLARLYILVPIGLAVAQLMTAPPAETSRERRIRGGAVLACAGALAATWTFADPRAAGAPSPLALTVDVLVFLTVAVAAGGLVVLRMAGAGDRGAVARFRTLAIWCAGLLALAGIHQAWQGIREFGWLLAGTAALLVVLAGTALLTRLPDDRKPVRRQAKARLRTRLLIPIGLVTLVLGGTGALVTLAPGQSAHAQGAVGAAAAAVREQVAPTRLAYDLGRPGGQGSIDLVLIPGTDEHGQARLAAYVTVLDDAGHPRDDVLPTAVLNPPDNHAAAVPLPLAVHAQGRSDGQANLPVHGTWQLALTLRTGDGGMQTITQPLDVH